MSKDLEVFLTLMDLIPKVSYFRFGADYSLQAHGTSMDTPMASTHANMFLDILKNTLK